MHYEKPFPFEKRGGSKQLKKDKKFKKSPVTKRREDAARKAKARGELLLKQKRIHELLKKLGKEGFKLPKPKRKELLKPLRELLKPKSIEVRKGGKVK